LKLNVATIGCGVWGKNHARVFNSSPLTSLIAVADQIESSAKQIGEQYKVGWYTDYNKLLDRSDIDAVTICTPTFTHKEIALSAIKSGKHVLVEKPMTLTVDEAKILIKAAEKHNVFLSVGFIERFNPAVQEAFRLLKLGEIGDPIIVNTNRQNIKPNRVQDVGVIKDIAIHDIDIINKIYQKEASSVYALIGSLNHNHEDYAVITVQYNENKIGLIRADWLTPNRVRKLIVTGTKGVITVEYATQKIFIENSKKIRQPLIEKSEPLLNELESFSNSILNNVQPEITGTDGMNALIVAEAALESGKFGQKVNCESFID
jgi:UDP-N-acetylglucosamine 3-dehydrogenase